MTSYAWYLAQTPVIVAHLRDSMLPLQAARYDQTKVSGTRDQPLPFRIEPMEDADELWAQLVWYGSVIAQHLGGPSPHALRGAWTNEHGDTLVRPSTRWNEVAEQAYTITAWLTYHQDDIGTLGPTVDSMAAVLFATIGRLLAKYRITPNRLRTTPTICTVCGEQAVRAEWAINRDGDIAQTVQCTVCSQRYEPTQLPTRIEVITLPVWNGLPLEEVEGEPAHILAGSPQSAPIGRHDQAVA